MYYLFLDESGDLGFDFTKRRTSRFFLVSILVTQHTRPLEKLVKKIHRNIRNKHLIKKGLLHAADIDHVSRWRFCRQLAEKEVRLVGVYLDKYDNLILNQIDTHLLYAQIVEKAVRTVIEELQLKQETVKITVSRRETNIFLNKQLGDHLQNSLHRLIGHDARIAVRPPQDIKGLQAADIASWSLFRYHEFNDGSYRLLLKPILLERPFME